MEQVEKCFICGKPDSPSNFGLWLVNTERRTVHVACWIATYESARGDANPAA
jgi:hypothetical protein